MTIVSHSFNDSLINQLAEDTQIAGKVIPKGFVNATAMCKANNKTWSSYARSEKAKSYAAKVSSALLNGRAPIITIEGVKSGSDKENQGTWVHIDVAIHLSMWISDDFAVWATEVLRRVINGEFKALTAEAKEAEKKLFEIWERLRKVSKESFWFIADAVKSYYLKHPKPEHFQGEHYSKVFDTLNLGLFGKKSKQIKEELGIPKGKLNRDNFGEESLKKIDMIQRIAEAQIIHQEKEPVESVKFALAMMSYSISNYKD